MMNFRWVLVTKPYSDIGPTTAKQPRNPSLSRADWARSATTVPPDGTEARQGQETTGGGKRVMYETTRQVTAVSVSTAHK